MIIELLQLILLLLIAFTLMFGLGFILNMLLKTTWFPIYGYFALIIGVVYWSWGSGTFVDNLLGYTLSDGLAILSGLGGAVLSGVVIKTLRLKGYKMF